MVNVSKSMKIEGLFYGHAPHENVEKLLLKRLLLQQ